MYRLGQTVGYVIILWLVPYDLQSTSYVKYSSLNGNALKFSWVRGHAVRSSPVAV